MRKIISIAAGLAGVFVTLVLLETAIHSFADKEFFLPATVAATFVASTFGLLVMYKLQRQKKLGYGIVFCGILLVVNLINLTSMPHPSWFWIMSLLSVVAVFYAAGKIYKVTEN